MAVSERYQEMNKDTKRLKHLYRISSFYGYGELVPSFKEWIHGRAMKTSLDFAARAWLTRKGIKK